MEMSPVLFGLYKLVKYLIYPFTWLVLLIGLLTILAWLPDGETRRRWVRFLASASLFIVFILSNPLLSTALMGILEQQVAPFDHNAIQHFDAIVVLGGGLSVQGSLRPLTELSALSRHRTLCGVTLFHNNVSSRLVFTGGSGAPFSPGPPESRYMKRLALRLGVPEEAILIETNSRTTYENAVRTNALLGNAKILVVSSARHLLRSIALFRKQGFEVEGYPCGYLARNRPFTYGNITPFDLLPSLRALSQTTAALHEFVGIIVYRLAGKL